MIDFQVPSGFARHFTSALILAFVALAPVGANDDVPTQAPSDARILLSPPDRFKFEGYPNAVRLADLNGDKITDFITYDSGRSLLTILYSRPGNTDGVKGLRLSSESPLFFEPRDIVISVTVAAMALADLNGDGLSDFAIASTQEQVLIYYQGQEGLRETPVRLDEKGKRLLLSDLDGDGRSDLLLIRDNTIAVLRQESDGTLGEAVRYSSSAAPSSDPVLADVNSDDLLDLAFTDAGRRQRLIVRLGEPGGAFGPERHYDVEDNSDLVDAGNGRLTFLEPSTRALRVISLAPDDRESPRTRASLAQPEVIPLPAELTSGERDLLALPSDKDGRGALIAVADGAELFVVERSASGQLRLNPLPSLAGVSRLSLLPEKALLLSSKESVLASLSLSSKETLTEFPAPVKLPAAPLAFATGPTPKGGPAGLWAAYREGDDKDSDITVASFTKDEESGELEVSASVEISDSFDWKPADLIAADLNNDGLGDFLVFFEYEKPLLYLATEEGTLEKMETKEGLKSGLLEDLKARDVLVADVDQDGQTEIVIARERFLRVYHLDAQNALSIKAQLAPPERKAKLTLPAIADLDHSGRWDLICVDEENKRLLVYHGTDGGDWDSPRQMELPDLRPQRIATGDFSGDGLDDILVLGQTAVALLRGETKAESGVRVATLHTRLTDIPQGLYGRVFGSRINLKGELAAAAPMTLFAVEARENMLEFLRADAEGTLESVYRFKVFAQTRQLDDQRLRRLGVEPHAVDAADIDGDGLIDLVALVHQNLIVYRQLAEKAESLETVPPAAE